MVNLPVLFTCLAAISAKAVNTLLHSDFLSSVPAAKASAISPLEIDLDTFLPFMAFIAFIGAMIMSQRNKDSWMQCHKGT